MIHFIRNEADLDTAIAGLIMRDPRMAKVLEAAGRPPVRIRDRGYAGLARIVMGQQLSVASAAAIWGRFEAAFVPFHHDAVIRARATTLAKLGLSSPKIKAVKEIGKAIASGALDLDALAQGEADAAHAALIKVHGIGPWTADIYLLFCLGHADAFPAGDLAVQEAAKIAFDLKTRPNAKELTKIAESWRPLRGAAAYLLWAYYKVAKGRSGRATDDVARKITKKIAKKTARKKSAKKPVTKKRVKKTKGKK